MLYGNYQHWNMPLTNQFVCLNVLYLCNNSNCKNNAIDPVNALQFVRFIQPHHGIFYSLFCHGHAT